MKKESETSFYKVHKHALSLRIAMLVFSGFLLFVVGGTIFFMYTQVYSTIGDVRTLIFLSENFGFEVIDFKRLERVEQQWDKKHNSSAIQYTRNPFYPVPVTESPTTTP